MSLVTSITGMNRVVPGLLVTHWLCGQTPGSTPGRSMRPSSSFSTQVSWNPTTFPRSPRSPYSRILVIAARSDFTT